ncbi:MAG: hypothetical protein OXL36_14965 [Bryobacterales bacterium]|nr:hypothetical protein [Bryobacterales bacterium]MDE0295850.1 hypothetical protein [Bryobacterales bacterium]
MLKKGATFAETSLWQLANWSMVDGFSSENVCRGIASGIRLVVRVTRGTRRFRRLAKVAHVDMADGRWSLRPA